MRLTLVQGFGRGFVVFPKKETRLSLAYLYKNRHTRGVQLWINVIVKCELITSFLDSLESRSSTVLQYHGAALSNTIR